MFNLFNYSANVLVILTEGGKYFALLVMSILAIRLWRRYGRVSSARKVGNLVLAGLVTVLAVLIGYVSMRHSLARMDSYYGKKAFRDGHLTQAFSLFAAAEQNWADPDTMARCAVCLLYMGEGDRGLAMLKQARDLRKGAGTAFEFYYEGMYRLRQGDVPGATRFLRAAARDETYLWPATKSIAVLELDQGEVAAAAEDMKPFMQVEVTEFDQAYVLASLKLAAGDKAEARALLNKVPVSNLDPVWKSRYDKLRAHLQD